MVTPEEAAAFAARVTGRPLAGAPKALAGGLLNLVWRVPLEGGSVIVKHAPPHAAAAPEIPLDPARLGFEARALAAVGPGGALAGLHRAVRAPAPLHYDPERHLLAMEDLGDPPSLERWLLTAGSQGGADPAAVEPALADLGAFIAALHLRSAALPALAVDFQNRAVQQTRYEVQYDMAEASLAAAGIPDATALGERARALGRRLLAPGRCLVMGDLWPRSVLMRADGPRVIDWEFAHWGRPGQDLGHLAAHLWMLARRGRVFDPWPAFINAYEALRPLTAADRWEASVHFGCEILARTTGAFQGGYLYEGLEPSHPAMQQAANEAARAMRLAGPPA